MNISKRKKNALILIVDDNPANIQLLGNNLRQDGVNIAIATDGKRAIQITQTKMPDLILLDIMMPIMDGYEVCKILKDNEKTRDIPIIFLTAKVSPEDILKGFELGAVDYITKPFNSHELIARVNTHLKLKFYTDEVKDNNQQLELLNQEKNEFLGIAAHDLKNPIYSISMLAQIMLEDDLSEEERVEFLQDIKSSTERMSKLISDLLDINAIEQGRLKMTIQEDNYGMMFDHCIKDYAERASHKDIELVVENANPDLRATSDKQLFHQILDNLVSNAIKFSPKSKNIYTRFRKNDTAMIIEVEDQGPGLSEDDKKKLFSKFAKMSAQPTGNESSTGLGLSIVKKYVDSLNGMIWVESEEGKGAKFICELPLDSSNQI
jgi:two-component system, sensor histidine kinase and response regulator